MGRPAQAAWDHRGDLQWRQGSRQKPEDVRRRLIEFLNRYELGLYLYDLDPTAYVELTYPEYCQMQDWQHDYKTVGAVLEHLGEAGHTRSSTLDQWDAAGGPYTKR